MNQLDKLGYLRMQNVMLDRSGILRENEGINNFKNENPDLFLKINLFVSELKNYNNRGLIVKVKVKYENVGRLVHNSNKIRCFKIEVLE